MLGTLGQTQSKAEPGIERWIYRCKRCARLAKELDAPNPSKPIAIEHPCVRWTVSYRDNHNRAYQLDRIHYGTTLRFEDQINPYDKHAPRCPVCRYRMQGEPIKGTYSPDRACDSRCQNAIGPSCDCQCGGANHGLGWVPAH